MSQHVVLTLRYGHEQHKDVALPYNVPANVLATALVQALEISGDDRYGLAVGDGETLRTIPPTQSLAEAGAMYGDRLHLVPLHPAGSPARLLSENGRQFPLLGQQNWIGRSTPQHKVTIDLTGLDTLRVVSRRHACIVYRENSYQLMDAGSLHGTHLNGKPLAANRYYPLHNNDLILLGGRKGVQLRFITDTHTLETDHTSG